MRWCCKHSLQCFQYLSLFECSNIDGKAVTQMNADQWKIPELVLPHVKSIPERAIEIDPHYN